MIQAVFFDLYGTLVRFYPPAELIQTSACREMGLRVSPQGIVRGYALADDFMSRENEGEPIAHRSVEERKIFFTQYQRLILQGAGVEASPALAARVWERVSQAPKELALYDDVVPALAGLKRQRLTLGLISNLNRDMEQLTRSLGLEPYLDFWVTSQEVGANKPHPPIFRAALAKASVEPAEALHVGDQYHSDVQGARGVGIRPLLLDREGVQPQPQECPKIRSLLEVREHAAARR